MYLVLIDEVTVCLLSIKLTYTITFLFCLLIFIDILNEIYATMIASTLEVNIETIKIDF